MGYSNSALASFIKISPNKTVPRNHVIDRITPHCYVGQVSIESMAGWLCNPNAGASANYGIAENGKIGLFVEEKDRSWCSSSRENDNRAVTIECASDVKHPYTINNTVYNRLIELCTDICRRNGKTKLIWFGDKDKTLSYNPKDDEMILSVHRWFANKACPGDYIYNRLGKIAETVTKALGGEIVTPTADKYVVRLAFNRPETQTNSFNNLDYAKAEADRHPGYSVYVTETGECIYTSPKTTGYTPDEWIALIAPIAQELEKKNAILPSVVIAQTALETGWGSTDLTSKFNIVGMKADLINSTWKDYTVWDGKTYTKVTPEYHNGQLVYVEDVFRVYKSFKQCLEDYEAFLLNVKNNKGYKYRRIQGKTNPAEVINIIRIGTGTNEHPEGYCTDPNYETKILKIIKDYRLTEFDTVEEVEQKDKYAVQRSLDETQFRLGLYRVLDNAKRKADENWGYKVYNVETGECVYEPTLSMAQKLVAKCLQFNDYVTEDLANNLPWRYYNNKKSANTFWATRDQGLRRTNCMGAVFFACEDIGIPSNALQWYGIDGGIRWLNENAEKNARKIFDIIEVRDKTVQQCIKEGIIRQGDIITYRGFGHTNIFLGNDTSYDGGHAFCNGSGEGAIYRKWVGETTYTGRKPACLIRIKQDTPSGKILRVQINAYKVKANANKCCKECKEKTGFDAFTQKESDGLWHVYCGSFEYKTNAKERLAYVKEHGYPKAFIVEVVK